MFHLPRRVAGMCAIIAVSASASIPAHALEANDPSGLHPLAFTAAQTPNARMAALVGNGAIVRAKGVVAFTHPSLGQFCFQPVTAIKIASIVPMVSVDWSSSSGSGLLAFYRSSGIGCDAGNIGVLTYSFSGGSDPVLSDGVGFTILVP